MKKQFISLLFPILMIAISSYAGATPQDEESSSESSNYAKTLRSPEELEQITLLGSLMPNEIYALFFSFLPPQDHASLRLACRRFKDIVGNESLWKHAFIKTFKYSPREYFGMSDTDKTMVPSKEAYSRVYGMFRRSKEGYLALRKRSAEGETPEEQCFSTVNFSLLRSINISINDKKLMAACPLQYSSSDLDLSCNGRDAVVLFPHLFRLLKNIEKMELSFLATSLAPLPRGINSVKKLQTLTFYSYRSNILPVEFGGLTSLSTLKFHYSFKVQGIGNFHNLRSNLKNLAFVGCKLTELPAKVCDLTALTALQLIDNELTSLPPEFSSLTNLRSLDLSCNKFRRLPEEIRSLTNLERLSYIECPIHDDDLPEWLSELKKLGTDLEITALN